jgi:hypothetical protein
VGGDFLDASQQEQDTVFDAFGEAAILNMFKNVKPSEAGKKLFGSHGSPIINDQEAMAVLSHIFADVIAIVDLLKGFSDNFNAKYPSGFSNMALFYSQLKLFLADPKNEEFLNQFLSNLKEKASALPVLVDDISNFEMAIKQHEAQLFTVAYSTVIKKLKSKFPTLREGLPLARIRKTTWQATTESIKDTVNSIKNAVMLRAKKMYYYLFRKNTMTQYQTWWDESKGTYVIEESVVEV